MRTAQQHFGSKDELIAEYLRRHAREAGAADPELLGEQLALLLDGASARTRTATSSGRP